MICRAGCGLIQPLLSKACSSSRLLSPAALASPKVHRLHMHNCCHIRNVAVPSPPTVAVMSCVADWTDTFQTLAGLPSRPQVRRFSSAAPTAAARQAPAQLPVQAHHRNGPA